MLLYDRKIPWNCGNFGRIGSDWFEWLFVFDNGLKIDEKVCQKTQISAFKSIEI